MTCKETWSDKAKGAEGWSTVSAGAEAWTDKPKGAEKFFAEYLATEGCVVLTTEADELLVLEAV